MVNLSLCLFENLFICFPNIIENDQNIHENLKYLLNDRINKYNEVYC